MKEMGRFIYDTKNKVVYDTESDYFFIQALIFVTSLNDVERFRTAHELEILLYFGEGDESK